MGRVKYTQEILANLREAALRGASLDELVEIADATPLGLLQSISNKVDRESLDFPEDKLRAYWKTCRQQRKLGVNIRTRKPTINNRIYDLVDEHLIDFISLLLDKKPCSLGEIREILHKSLETEIHKEKVEEVLDEYVKIGLIIQENGKYKLSRNEDTEKYLAFLKNRKVNVYSQENKLAAPYHVDRDLMNKFLVCLKRMR